MIPTKFCLIWPSGFRGKDFLETDQSEKELPVAAMIVFRSGRNEKYL